MGSLGRSSSQLATRMKTKIVTASGTTKGDGLPMFSSTCASIVSTMVSQKTWTLVGTDLVTLRRSAKPSPITIMPAIAVVQIVSMFSANPKRVTVL